MRNGQSRRHVPKADIAEHCIANHKIPFGPRIVTPLGLYTGNSIHPLGALRMLILEVARLANGTRAADFQIWQHPARATPNARTTAMMDF